MMRSSRCDQTLVCLTFAPELPDVPEVEDDKSDQQKNTESEANSETGFLRVLAQRPWLLFFLLSRLDWLFVGLDPAVRCRVEQHHFVVKR
jgi:hypothetical protein